MSEWRIWRGGEGGGEGDNSCFIHEYLLGRMTSSTSFLKEKILLLLRNS
jgi:hypothetical protein